MRLSILGTYFALDVGQWATWVPEAARSLHVISNHYDDISTWFHLLDIRIIQMDHMSEDSGLTQQANGVAVGHRGMRDRSEEVAIGLDLGAMHSNRNSLLLRDSSHLLIQGIGDTVQVSNMHSDHTL